MSPTTDILLTAAGLQPGERQRIECPACGGRDTMLLSVEETGEVRWHCFRASCSTTGSSGGTRKVAFPRSRKVRKTQPYRGELEYLSPLQRRFLRDTIGWQDSHIEMARALWAPEDRRYVFPILGPMAVRRGYVLRSYLPTATPKALTRMELEEPHMSWYPSGTGPLVIVEDIPSAVRAAHYTSAVALCGTGVSAEYANEIVAHAQDVVWALDADATALAIRLHRRHSPLFARSRVLVLEKDIKNMEEQELQEFMQEHGLYDSAE